MAPGIYWYVNEGAFLNPSRAFKSSFIYRRCVDLMFGAPHVDGPVFGWSKPRGDKQLGLLIINEFRLFPDHIESVVIDEGMDYFNDYYSAIQNAGYIRVEHGNGMIEFAPSKREHPDGVQHYGTYDSTSLIPRRAGVDSTGSDNPAGT